MAIPFNELEQLFLCVCDQHCTKIVQVDCQIGMVKLLCFTFASDHILLRHLYCGIPSKWDYLSRGSGSKSFPETVSRKRGSCVIRTRQLKALSTLATKATLGVQEKVPFDVNSEKDIPGGVKEGEWRHMSGMPKFMHLSGVYP